LGVLAMVFPFFARFLNFRSAWFLLYQKQHNFTSRRYRAKIPFSMVKPNFFIKFNRSQMKVLAKYIQEPSGSYLSKRKAPTDLG
jgi:hypothetical protein